MSQERILFDRFENWEGDTYLIVLLRRYLSQCLWTRVPKKRVPLSFILFSHGSINNHTVMFKQDLYTNCEWSCTSRVRAHQREYERCTWSRTVSIQIEREHVQCGYVCGYVSDEKVQDWVQSVTSLVLSVTTSNHDELITHLVQPFQIYLPNKFRPNRYQILNVSCQSLGHTWSHDTFAGTFFLGRTFDHFFELIIFVSGSSQHDFSCFTIQTPLIIMMKSSNAYDIVVVCYHC